MLTIKYSTCLPAYIGHRSIAFPPNIVYFYYVSECEYWDVIFLCSVFLSSNFCCWLEMLQKQSSRFDVVFISKVNLLLTFNETLDIIHYFIWIFFPQYVILLSSIVLLTFIAICLRNVFHQLYILIAARQHNQTDVWKLLKWNKTCSQSRGYTLYFTITITKNITTLNGRGLLPEATRANSALCVYDDPTRRHKRLENTWIEKSNRWKPTSFQSAVDSRLVRFTICARALFNNIKNTTALH